ncbi:MAG: methyltransferase domain-containing protein [bacterium]
MNTYKIESVNMRGIGVIRSGKQRIRVPGAIAGERVKLDIVYDKYGNCFGKIQNLLETSNQRVAPNCNNFPSCPGCGLRHLSGNSQSQRIIDFVKSVTAKELQASEIPEPVFHGLRINEKYRTRCVLSLHCLGERSVLGMKSHFPDEPPISLSSCPNHHPDLNHLIQITEKFLNEGNPAKKILQNIREVHFNLSADGLHRILFVILDHEKVKNSFKQILSEYFKSMDISILCLTVKSYKSGITYKEPEVLSGNRWISIETQFAEFRALPGVWTPVVPESVNQVVETLQDDPSFEGCGNLLELGCGAGLITVPLAGKTTFAIGIDRNRHAIESAIINAERLNISNIAFRTGKAQHTLRKFAAQGKKANFVIIHGMRKPFGSEVMDLIQALKNRSVILMSPSINAWFQDLRPILKRKWRLTRINIFDQLPHTAGYLLYGNLLKDND